MGFRDSLRLTAIATIWFLGLALIPLAVLVFVATRVYAFLKVFLPFMLTNAWLILIGLVTRLYRLVPKGKHRSSAPERFAFVSHVLPPSWSGQAVVIKRLLEGVEGSRYCLISSQYYGSDSNTSEDFIGRLPATYYYLPPEWAIKSHLDSRLVQRLNSFFAIMIRGFRIANLLAGTGSRVVVVASGDTTDLPAAYIASCVTGARLVLYLFDDFTYQWPEGDGRGEAETIESIIFHKQVTVVVPNEFLEDEVRRRHPGVRTVVVRNPSGSIDGTFSLRGEESRQDRPGAIVYTGAIYHVNFSAFRNLIKAIEKPGISRAEIHLFTAQDRAWLAGQGICHERIVFHEHVPPEEVINTQGGADILFMAFSFDSTIPELVRTSAPGKLGDYLVSGVPILAHVPHDCFVAHYLNKYECGVVISENSPEALAEGIRRLLTDTDLRTKLLVNAKKRAEADFRPPVAREAFFRAIGENK